MDSVSSINRKLDRKNIIKIYFQETHLFDLNSYTLEHILKYLEIEDIKNVSIVNQCGYNVTKQWFETESVLILPEIISSEIINCLRKSARNYNNVIYKLDKMTKGNILEFLKDIPFRSTTRTSFYWKNVEEVEHSKNFQVEVFSSQVTKAYKISDHVTKISLNSKPLSILFDVFKTFRNLEELHLSNLRDDGEYYEEDVFQKHKKLKIVKFSCATFILTSNLLNTFKGLTSLEFHSIDDIEFVKGLIENNQATLKHLSIELTTEISEIILSCQLYHLEVNSSKVTVSLKNLLEHQKNLRTLVLWSPQVDNFLKSFLENCETLDTLSVNDPKSNDIDIFRVHLPNVKRFVGNVQSFIPISKNLRYLQTEVFTNTSLSFENLCELILIKRPKIEREHRNFECFEDFKDYHISEPLDSSFLRTVSTIKTLKLKWIISLNEYKKVIKELQDLEVFHFSIQAQDLKGFQNYFDSGFNKKLRFVLMKIEIPSVNDYSIVKQILENEIDELLLGDFFKPFSIFVDLDLKAKERKVLYFSSY